ncbi:DUF2254 domain-containing protein [Aliiglaciecola lipolytica]|uniref:DUF2254 domain-containing protein n=1 Tax=Aliiglaciecola lipolytica E3 TaxID=1127673 RepID=K6XYJ4_9ALTE|nr:DUF2254 domain-containing protein [Aliiglaciecola lipolytica]GAC16716.1 hypothetical protein GLIP_4105 [Aliiglaciecola lipolytica E3]
MKNLASIDKLFDSIKTSFWFIPILMVVTSIVSAWLMVWIDHAQAWGRLDWLKFLYQTDQDTLLSLVNTIAASMITVTSIAFSITIVTLTLASSQFGPRLIRNFMDDRGTQLVLGTFISNFSYCVVLIYCMSLDSNQGIKMGLSIIWCLLATLCSVFILIYFIHHVARSIQADNVINEICHEINRSVEPLYFSEQASSTQNSLEGHFVHSLSIETKHSGYLQVLSCQTLCQLAQTHDMLVEFHWRPGDLINKHAELAVLKSHKPIADDLQNEINQCCVIGSIRTPIQDPEYAIHQMVEIAVRALSTGVNDPYTAITCVDKLCLVLCDLATHKLHQGLHYDGNGVLRLKRRPYDFSGLANSAFDQIRQYAQDSVAVTIRLLESLHRIAIATDKTDIHHVLREQLKAIQEIKQKAQYTVKDSQDFDKSVHKLERELLVKAESC